MGGVDCALLAVGGSDGVAERSDVCNLFRVRVNLFSAGKHFLSQANRVGLATLCLQLWFTDSRHQTGHLGLKGKRRLLRRQWSRDKLDKTFDEELNETRGSADLSESISVIRLWPSRA